MAKILIVAHAPLASSLQAVARHVYPECGSGLSAVDVAPGAKLEETEARLRESLAACGGAEVLILTDVFGATPCNAALNVVDGGRARVVAGVNVPMLWRALCYLDQPLEELVNRALTGGTQGVMHVAVPRRQNQASPAVSHDQVQPRHQQ